MRSHRNHIGRIIFSIVDDSIFKAPVTIQIDFRDIGRPHRIDEIVSFLRKAPLVRKLIDGIDRQEVSQFS